jgi:hypothetical protein
MQSFYSNPEIPLPEMETILIIQFVTESLNVLPRI